ncbi:protein ABHD11-like isoform X2 [Chrysoperla carnea]|uniref:protein ABHD11-like isoform X2 n=1 Tax=Chrysoperla carnea TaxID=189513 RepID=UPI001D07CBCA|nr:protein ABHD11-like isoform X2 [Chrysoperla carnea]
MGQSNDWAGIAKSLLEDLEPPRKIYVVDNRNHGHSMGGRASMYAALKYPDQVSSVIIIDISPIEGADDMKKILAEPLQLLQKLAKFDLKKQTGNILEVRKYVDNELKKIAVNAPDYREFLLQNINRNTDGSYNWKINIPALLENYNSFKSLHVGNLTYDKPMLLIAGEKSKFVPKSHAEDIKKIFTNARLEFLPTAGHMIHIEDPRSLCELVVNFLKYEK